MNKIIHCLIAICFMTVLSSTCFAGLKDYPNVAVLPFSKKADVSDDLKLEDGEMVSEYIIEALFDSGRFNVIEREQMKAIADEHSFNMTGLVDLGTAVQIGKLCGVKYLIYGSIVGLSTKEGEFGYDNSAIGGIGNKKHKVIANLTARIIDVETGRIVLAGHGNGSSTSTHTEFSLRKKSSNNNSYYDSTNTLELESESYATDEDYITTEDTSALTYKQHTFKIGTATVSQEQVHNALYKAVNDVLNGKFGLLTKMDGKGKIKNNKK